MLRPREIPSVLAESLHCAVHDNCFLLAKAASYSAALSLFPGLIVLAELLLRGNAERTLEDLTVSMGQVLPPSVQVMLADYLTTSGERSLLVLTVGSLAAVIFGSDIMSSLMEGFRAAYRVPRRRTLWRDYRVAIMLVFLTFIPLAAANAALILSRQIQAWAGRTFGESDWVAASSRLSWWVIALATFTIILGVLYYVAPNRHQRWRDVMPGALLGALLLAPVTGLFTFYVQRIARYREFYGNVSTVVLLLIWTYLVSVVVLLGCEFNAARERRLGTLAPRAMHDH
ncbi:MAG: YihY/virulence factor BrkB family protein [Acidobacteria bacterium]|nr:YihY/virulence factor BrkB family protein [Acidobacteriota bacterium]